MGHGTSLAREPLSTSELLHESLSQTVVSAHAGRSSAPRLPVRRRSGSVQAAAGNLGYTASAVSQQITTLQRETGLVLSRPVGRGIEPTAAGRAFAAAVDGVLGRGSARSRRSSRDLRAGRTGSLSMAYFASVGSAWMPTWSRTLLGRFPGLGWIWNCARTARPARPKRPDIQLVVARRDRPTRRSARTTCSTTRTWWCCRPATRWPGGRGRAGQAGRRELGRQRLRPGLVPAQPARGVPRGGFQPAVPGRGARLPDGDRLRGGGHRGDGAARLGAKQLPPGVVAVPVTSPTPVRSIYALVREGVADTPAVRTVLRVLTRLGARSAGTPGGHRPAEGSMIRAARGLGGRHGRGLAGRRPDRARGGDRRCVRRVLTETAVAGGCGCGTSSATSPSRPTCW